jgi:hypothetical protein
VAARAASRARRGPSPSPSSSRGGLGRGGGDGVLLRKELGRQSRDSLPLVNVQQRFGEASCPNARHHRAAPSPALALCARRRPRRAAKPRHVVVVGQRRSRPDRRRGGLERRSRPRALQPRCVRTFTFPFSDILEAPPQKANFEKIAAQGSRHPAPVAPAREHTPSVTQEQCYTLVILP